MATIIIPRKHLRQPQGRVELAQEYAGSLRGAFRFERGAWIDDVAMLLYAGTDTAGRATQGGIAGNFNGSTSGVNLGNRSDLFSGAAFSVELLLVADAASVGDTVRKQLVSKDSAAGREINIQIGDDASGITVPGGLSLAFFNGDNTQVAQTGGAGVAPGVLAHLCFVCRPAMGGSGVELYLDGRRVTSTALYVGVSSIGATATDLYIGRRVYSGYEEHFAGAIHAVWCHGKALSAAEIQTRASAPWAIYRADPVRIYSFPTGAISINSITASSITQTGATITLGLTR